MSFFDKVGKVIDAAVSGAVVKAAGDDDSKDVQPVQGTKTLYDEVKARWPEASPEAIEEVVWLTPYPLANRATVVASLDQMKERWGDKIGDVIQGEYDEMHEFLKKEKGHGTDQA